MKISVASGKGGTGKTTIATNLAAVARPPVCYVDCDVEAPNGHLFLSPVLKENIRISVPVPRVIEALCDFCGKCREVCRFNSIAVLPTSVMVFDELCHGCGGCVLACPVEAVYEEQRTIGVLEKGTSGSIDFISGKLNVGEAMAPPLIRAVKQEIPHQGLVLIDVSPGTSCPVITSIRDTHFCLLVTEPTPFGLSDLELAVEMVRKIGIPFGVVINRDGIGTRETEDYCEAEQIQILMRIPDDRRIAEAYSRGEMVVDTVPQMRERFKSLLEMIANGRRSVSIG